MANTRLIKPDKNYKNAFLTYVEEIKKSGSETYELYKNAEIDFKLYVDELKNTELGIGLPNGWVPCSSYWLVDSKDEVLGVIRIRHRVDSDYLQTIGHIGYEIKMTRRREGNGNQILKMGLLEAGKMGINNLLITCDEGNIGSVRIIEKNNGKLKSSFIDSDTGERVLQYIVKL
ncbi:MULTISPECIES: GNAT family N-acetyltransferase [Psychrilyobacter]|uniref:GNAT family N-acetyltransferase n=1 Tax=Psychrilyobacter piezotolerans TaxID=2293438 RepID=A0ABX9KEU8_9FUSO|nr:MULTISPECIES: GNAT family N-acetyltransferase [Psychrilyobacter]MCS5422529.1 GNAT family N-acetyltransferase [Psychrilyobacter sp. S5]NDI78731.1 GNAT family N-acetyltransferase [Psychrilyobacter piezotolerans]RDE59580.1 GNAT family N-acetyltransferase [Psychrilyobacter sp. S5]REI39994.1 GNAT family N-acetyltransferase [Psychrilyobacter piezotolerans]